MMQRRYRPINRFQSQNTTTDTGLPRNSKSGACPRASITSSRMDIGTAVDVAEFRHSNAGKIAVAQVLPFLRVLSASLHDGLARVTHHLAARIQRGFVHR